MDLLPVLRNELSSLKADTTEPGRLVFPTAAGTREDRNRVRAEELASALPEGLTLHALRRTFASVLIALGHDSRYVMEQIRHTNPVITLGIYAQVMRVSGEDRERLRALVEGDEQIDHVDGRTGAALAA